MSAVEKKKRIVLAIRSLDIGGAERQFIELVKGLNNQLFDLYVVTMYGGEMEDLIKAQPITYINLQKKGRFDIKFYFRYKALLQEINPDVIYSFLGEMNLFSYWTQPNRAKLIWGFRASNKDFSKYGKISQMIFALQKLYSKKVDKIIANSSASIEFHKSRGFYMDRAVVVPNGIDTNRFKPNKEWREEIRSSYAIDNEEIVLGIVARLDPVKGYPILAKALRMLFEKYENLRFLAVGYGDEQIAKEVDEILGRYQSSFIWVGKRKDVEKFYNAFDLYVSSSITEGFSNSIAEAMSCGVPVVATDVGDSKVIVGKCGSVVPPNDPKVLADAIERMLATDLQRLGECARNHIVQNFSIPKMVEHTQKEILQCVE